MGKAKRRPFGIECRSLLALSLSDFNDLPCRFIQVHIIEFQRRVVINRDAKGILNIVEGRSALDNVGRVIRGPHATHLFGIGVLWMVTAVPLQRLDTVVFLAVYIIASPSTHSLKFYNVQAFGIRFR